MKRVVDLKNKAKERMEAKRKAAWWPWRLQNCCSFGMSVGESWAEDILDNMSGILRVFEEQVTVRILQYYTVFRYIQVLGVRMFMWVALGCPRLPSIADRKR